VTLDPARATAEIADVEKTARTALAEIREAIGGYRSRGLAAEIEAARHTLDAAGVELISEGSPSTGSLSPQEETALALALREAVTNIVRHAHANTCRLRFYNESGMRRFVIEDDGPRTVVTEGNGLRGMRQRIESLGGRFTLERAAREAVREASREAPREVDREVGREVIAQPRGTRLILELPVLSSLKAGTESESESETAPSNPHAPAAQQTPQALPHTEAAAS
jgi:signal transduction histidine kinase